MACSRSDQRLPDSLVDVFFAIGIDVQLAARILITPLRMEIGQTFDYAEENRRDDGAADALTSVQKVSQ